MSIRKRKQFISRLKASLKSLIAGGDALYDEVVMREASIAREEAMLPQAVVA